MAMNELLSDPTVVTMRLGVCSGSTGFTPHRLKALRLHHCSMALCGSSGYRGVAAMIASEWVKPLTGTDEERVATMPRRYP